MNTAGVILSNSLILKLKSSQFRTSILLMSIRATSLLTKFILTLYIAKYMDFKILGSYGFIGVLSVALPIFLSLSIMQIVARRVITEDRADIAKDIDYYSRFTLLIYLCLLFISAIFSISYQKDVTLFLIVIFVVLLEHLNNDFYLLLLNLFKHFHANALHLIRTAGWIIPFIAISFLNPDFRTLECLLIFWCIGGFLTLIGHIWITRKWLLLPIEKRDSLFKWLIGQFRLSKHAYFTSCIATTQQNINQFFIIFFLGLELNGIYVFFNQVTSAASNLMNTGIIQLARPLLVKAYKDKDSNYILIYKKCLKNTSIFSFLTALIMFPCMYIVTHYVVDKPLAEEWFPLFTFILINYILSLIADAQNSIFYSQYRDDITLNVFIVSFFAVLIFSVIFIPILSLYGVALAIAIGLFVRLYLQIKYSHKLIEKST